MKGKALLTGVLSMLLIANNCVFAQDCGTVDLNGVLTFDEACEYIGETEFYQNSEIKEVVMSDNIKSMGIGAFSGCENLQSVTLSSQITTIPEAAFNSCKQLKAIEIPQNVTSIGAHAFSYCSALREITLPKNLAEIDTAAFQMCDLLETIVIPDNVETISDSTFFADNSLKNVVLPENLQVIDEKAFAFCTALEEIFLPDGTQTIGANAFWNCNALKNIYIPSSVINIGEKAFFDYSPTIYGYVGSYAEQYAQEQGFEFVAVTESIYEQERDNLLAEIEIAGSVENSNVITVGYNENEIVVESDGEKVIFTDAKPFIDENDRTQIPVRAVAEMLGFDVDYEDGTVTLQNDERKITLCIGKEDIVVDFGYGVECSSMDTTARIVNDRTYVPIRYIGEMLGYAVEWK